MFSNKFAFALVLIGIISVSNMVSSSALVLRAENATTPDVNATTTTPPTTTTFNNATTTFNNATTTSGAGYPSISYGMLFSVCSALFYLIF